MNTQQKATAINARAVAIEMTALMAYALLMGVVVSVLVAMPVLLLSVTVS